MWKCSRFAYAYKQLAFALFCVRWKSRRPCLCALKLYHISLWTTQRCPNRVRNGKQQQKNDPKTNRNRDYVRDNCLAVGVRANVGTLWTENPFRRNREHNEIRSQIRTIEISEWIRFASYVFSRGSAIWPSAFLTVHTICGGYTKAICARVNIRSSDIVATSTRWKITCEVPRSPNYTLCDACKFGFVFLLSFVFSFIVRRSVFHTGRIELLPQIQQSVRVDVKLSVSFGRLRSENELDSFALNGIRSVSEGKSCVTTHSKWSDEQLGCTHVTSF